MVGYIRSMKENNTRNDLESIIKKNPFVSFESLQHSTGACQGSAMINLVTELAKMVESKQIAVWNRINPIDKTESSGYEWIGNR